jgi:hypothetical protein
MATFQQATLSRRHWRRRHFPLLTNCVGRLRLSNNSNLTFLVNASNNVNVGNDTAASVSLLNGTGTLNILGNGTFPTNHGQRRTFERKRPDKRQCSQNLSGTLGGTGQVGPTDVLTNSPGN